MCFLLTASCAEAALRLISEFHMKSGSWSQLTSPAEVKKAARPSIDACHRDRLQRLRTAGGAGRDSWQVWGLRLHCSCLLPRVCADQLWHTHGRAVMRCVRLGIVHGFRALAVCTPWCHTGGGMLDRSCRSNTKQVY